MLVSAVSRLTKGCSRSFGCVFQKSVLTTWRGDRHSETFCSRHQRLAGLASALSWLRKGCYSLFWMQNAKKNLDTVEKLSDTSVSHWDFLLTSIEKS